MEKLGDKCFQEIKGKYYIWGCEVSNEEYFDRIEISEKASREWHDEREKQRTKAMKEQIKRQNAMPFELKVEIAGIIFMGFGGFLMIFAFLGFAIG